MNRAFNLQVLDIDINDQIYTTKINVYYVIACENHLLIYFMQNQ